MTQHVEDMDPKAPKWDPVADPLGHTLGMGSPKHFAKGDGMVTFGVPRPQKVEAKETQVGGSHYRDMKIQPIEFILCNNLGFAEGNIVKYVCRYRSKGGLEDLNKAIHYIELLKETYYGT